MAHRIHGCSPVHWGRTARSQTAPHPPRGASGVNGEQERSRQRWRQRPRRHDQHIPDALRFRVDAGGTQHPDRACHRRLPHRDVGRSRRRFRSRRHGRTRAHMRTDRQPDGRQRHLRAAASAARSRRRNGQQDSGREPLHHAADVFRGATHLFCPGTVFDMHGTGDTVRAHGAEDACQSSSPLPTGTSVQSPQR